MSTVIVVNTQERFLALPKSAPQGNPNHPIVWSPEFLHPGTNEIDAALFERLRERPTVKAWEKAGWIKSPPKTKTDGEGLGAFPSDVAITLVTECFNPDLIATWLETEKRKEVRKAATDRRAELERLIADSGD